MPDYCPTCPTWLVGRVPLPPDLPDLCFSVGRKSGAI